MKKITLLFFLFFTSHFYSQVPVATIEYQALVDFYNATNGSSWYNQWNISSNNLHTTAWPGVSVANGHIVGLSLGLNKVKGAIPASFSNLKYLRTLELGYTPSHSYNNDLSATDLSNLSGLESLEYLGLSNCKLSGSLPETWYSLSKLKTLIIDNNALSGPIFNGLGNLKDLETMNFQKNQFTAIPASISSLTKLKTIDLSYNKISVLIPELEDLTSLTSLKLDYNAVGTIEGLLPTKVSLSLTYQTLALQELIYRGDDVVLTNLPSICRYDRSKNDFSALNTFNLYLRGSNMGSMQVSADGSLTIPKQYLYTLKSGNAVYLKMVGGAASQLQINFTTTTLDLPMLPDIEYQALVDFYNATGGTTHWSNKWNVSTNTINQGTWYGVSIENGHIVELNLRSNGVNGTIPASFSNLKYLRKLDLYNNNFSTADLSNLSGLERLEDLNLSYCQLSGSLPAAWSSLSKLKTLTINNNTLSGPIFNELGALKDLEYMNFQNNQFTAIPASISGLTKLKQISLEYNKIPVLIKELENLTSLTYLNLNYNAVGTIEGLLPTNVTLYLNYQSGVALQELIYTGNDVVIVTPASRSISTYNRGKNDFSALNTILLIVRGNAVASIQVSPDGSLRIPKNHLSAIKQGDAVGLRVETNNGVTYQSTIGFTATVDLPMIPNEEYQALVDFYNATRGPSWTNKWTVTTNNLNVSSSPWHGVLTENGHIVELNLNNNGVNGTIPASFSNLKYLRKLSLYGSYLSTADLGNLSGLESLEYLELGNCQLSGSLPETWSNLLKLKTLNIYNNTLSGPIFNGLGALKDLETISFYSNQFTAIPASISGLTKLKTISLQSNKISAVIKELENLPSLTYLNLDSNAVTTIEGLLPTKVGLYLQNQTVVLENFVYRGENVVIPNLPTICKYDRAKNDFSALNTFVFYLRGANMGSIQVSADGSLTIPKQYINSIKKGDAVYLQMSNGSASGFRINFTTTTVDLPIIPEAEYQALVDFYNATAGASWTNKWTVTTNNLHEGPWYGMTIENGHIVELNLRDNRVNGAIPASFSNLKYLRKLDLFYNNFSTTNLSNLSGLERLEYLDLSYCKLNGSLPETWSSLLQLKTINIMVNTLSGPIFNGLGDLKNLETINFSNNQFTAVPASISGLTKLKTIDLNANKISVLIKEFESLTSLTSLNLSSNTITDIQGLLPNKVSLSLTSQTISFDNFVYRGNDVVLTNIPNICKYDRTKNDFSALNTFRLYLRGGGIGVDLKVLADGSLTIPKQHLYTLKQGDAVFLYMISGAANAFRINFTTVTVDLPMIPEAEYQALVDFYNATAGANWSNKWTVTKNDLNERVWYGVLVEDGHIVELNLPYNNIKGSIPASFSNLKYLRKLDLSPPSNYGSNTNNFSTADLSNLSGLESLEYLGLSYCSLKGSLPATWSSLSKLKTLIIHNNAIENIDASFAVLQPTSLNFNYQNITAETADIVYDTMSINLPLYMTMNVTNGVVTFNTKNLFYLYLNGSVVRTAYADNGKVVFDKMNTLVIKATDKLRLYQVNGIAQYSSIYYNKISFGPPLENSEYEALKNIHTATNGSQWTNKWTIAENNLDRVSWYGVSIKDGHVVSLNLPQNNLTGTLHEEITALPYLEVLNFSGNKIEGSMPQNISLMPNLQVMDLTSNLLSGTIPASISSLSKLKKFTIGNNKFGGTIPAALSDFTVLEHLDISSNSFDAIEKKLYYDFTKTYIDLRNQRITYDVILKLDGNQLKVTLDDIVKYDLRANNFEARNSFSLLVNGITHSTTVMNNLGEIIFDNVRINEIPLDAKILVRQTTGSFEGAEFSYAGIEDKSRVPVLESEYLAMVAFFNAMGGDQWINKWNVSSNSFHINKWYGVTTYDGHIVSIDLTSNNVTGQVPAIFTEVPFLNKLVLSSNKVTAIEAVVPAAIDFVYDRQTIDMGAIDLVFGSILKNAEINQYEHKTGTFNSQSYDLKIGSFYRNINISTEGLQLTDLMYHWKFPNGQKLELRQISGASKNSILNYTLAYKSGDSNLDNTLNVLDIQTTVNYIMKEYVRYFNYGAADVNNDSTINILDVIGLVNKIQNQSLSNRIAQKTASAREEVETKAILSIENNTLIIDTKDYEITSLEILVDNIQKQQIQDQLSQLGFSVFVNETPDNKISLIAFSFFNSLKGKVAIAKLTTESVIINNAILSNSSAGVIPVEIKQATTIFEAVDVKVINYPNPFVIETTIEVPIEEPLDSPVLSIYDFATGKKVQEQALERITPIYNKIKFNRGNLPSGIYLYIISDKNKSIKSKMYIK